VPVGVVEPGGAVLLELLAVLLELLAVLLELLVAGPPEPQAASSSEQVRRISHIARIRDLISATKVPACPCPRVDKFPCDVSGASVGRPADDHSA
jgi:hypothetical protein